MGPAEPFMQWEQEHICNSTTRNIMFFPCSQHTHTHNQTNHMHSCRQFLTCAHSVHNNGFSSSDILFIINQLEWCMQFSFRWLVHQPKISHFSPNNAALAPLMMLTMLMMMYMYAYDNQQFKRYVRVTYFAFHFLRKTIWTAEEMENIFPSQNDCASHLNMHLQAQYK